MGMIDRQRISAVRTLEALGFIFDGFDWKAPIGESAPSIVEADALHALLVQRADALAGCTEGSPEEKELAAITDGVSGYEARRWPNGRAEGGKG